jgi:TrmH family RNA methyltransferase
VPAVRIVLVRPETGANVGACARVVKNAGLAGLDLVAPADWRTVECWRTAWGAPDVLERARVFPDLASAVGEATYVVALSARPPSGLPALDVREMAGQVASRGERDRVALVFGPETAGLTREEIASCGRCAAIPSDPGQPSLNLSHAVMVAAYEVFRCRRRAAAGPRLATHAEKDATLDRLREGLLAIDALPSRNTDGYFREWRALVARTDLTPKELRLIGHVARKMKQVGTARGAETTPQRHRGHRDETD